LRVVESKNVTRSNLTGCDVLVNRVDLGIVGDDVQEGKSVDRETGHVRTVARVRPR
jgi:hypothetical protein